jgi:hypothetical protein
MSTPPIQVMVFLGEQGISPDWLALPEGTGEGDAHTVLAAVPAVGRRQARRSVSRNSATP